MVLDTKKSNFENQKCLRFHIWFIMTLYYKMWHIITKWDSYFTIKCIRLFAVKCGSFITYSLIIAQYVNFKMRQLLQNVTFIAKCVEISHIKKSIFFKCSKYWKLTRNSNLRDFRRSFLGKYIHVTFIS